MKALRVTPMKAGSAASGRHRRAARIRRPGPRRDDRDRRVRNRHRDHLGRIRMAAPGMGPPRARTRVTRSCARGADRWLVSGKAISSSASCGVPTRCPCINCAAGEWDFCRNGQYTERGIKEHDGYCSERYRITPDFTVKVDPDLGLLGVLLEPTSVVAKAWEQVERIGSRATLEPNTAVITGAGPIGLLAALIGVQRGLDVTVIDQVTAGPKPDLVAGLGAHYHTGTIESAGAPPDIVIECTGVDSLVFDAMDHLGPGGVVCLTGVSSGGRTIDIDGGLLNRNMVLENEAVVGSVNANRRHYEAAAQALAKADRSWLERVVSRRVPLEQWSQALERQPDDVKVVIQVGPAPN